MFDPPIQKRKTTLMQRIQQAAARGYFHHTSGTIQIDKTASFANKMHDLYHVGINENQRSYRRRQGKANAFLYLYPLKNSDQFLWWLLATDGDGDVHQKEKLFTVFDKHNRLKWQGDYELVAVPSTGKKRPVMTWRMTRDCYLQWNDRIRKAVRMKYTNDKVQQAIWSLGRTPGFSEIRTQAKTLFGVLKAEWKRTRKDTDAMPPIPRLGYVRGLASETIQLSIILKRLKNAKPAFPRKDSTTWSTENE